MSGPSFDLTVEPDFSANLKLHIYRMLQMRIIWK